MRLMIVDASVAVKWFVDEKKGQEDAMKLLHKIQNQPRQFAVPELFFNEMLTVFCRLAQEVKLIYQYLEAIEEMGWERLGNGRECLRQAAHLATTYHLTGYDAIYAANAVLVDGIWITADSRAHTKIKTLGISSLLGEVQSENDR